MNATDTEVLEALKECAGLLDQLLNRPGHSKR
jgi:hypothetical protein